MALVYSVRTVLRNPVWKDNYTLFTTDIEYSPNSAKLRNACGGELLTQSLVSGPQSEAGLWPARRWNTYSKPCASILIIKCLPFTGKCLQLPPGI